MPVGLGGLLDHADAGVADRDLLENDRIARGLLQRQPERRQRLVELARGQQLGTLAVVIDGPVVFTAEKLLPEGHARDWL